MTKETSIVNLLFSAALAALFCLCSCTEKQHTTDPEPPKLPIGFRPMSQAVVVKSGSAFPESIQKFGVWGVAGNDLNIQYLWSPSTLIDVNRQSDGTYKPAADGYWFSYSTHDFLALASDPSTVALPAVNITTTGNPNALNPSMTFSYDLSERYNAKNYTYDLLGAAARKTITTVADPSQDLLFWHLFAKIKMEIKFLDVDGNEMTESAPVLTNVTLKGVKTQGNYEITYAGTEINPYQLSCSVTTPDASVTGDENGEDASELEFSSAPTLNIIPQDISGFSLFLDFTRTILDDNKGTSDPNDDVYTEVPVNNFEINLTPAKKMVEILDPETNTKISPYAFNNQYNWKITISSKNVVNFTVTVNDWQDPDEDKQIPSIDII